MAWHTLETFGTRFFDEAPVVATRTMALPTEADAVWDELTGDHPLHWCRLLRGGRYLTPVPHGVGTIRRMGTIGGALRLQEQFISWDDANRTHAFRVSHSSLPGLRRFGERYEVRPTPTGCDLTWTIVAQAQPGARVLHPIVKRVAQSLFTDTEKYFQAAGRPAASR
ncbi:SRPBCC family protein [Mycolicibacterium llatzerense]|uniref:SRPBCC family protein n=1 Tax=Mycolicibacterium llatzerense TaxID=280871 RepID=UPI0021B6CB37|nr:SRPBCC family protein [Mycolicibacterium llatzerense]MCT7370993.1 hypothetical protein [Mycolicibacterium llatzerense]